MFLNVGLVASLSLTIMAFEWKSVYDGPTVNLPLDYDFEPIVEMPLTSIPPPPKPKPVPVVIVETKKEVEEEIAKIDTEYIEEAKIPNVIIEEMPEEPVEILFTIVEQMPSPVGGMNTFFKFVGKNLKYPNQARRMGIEGKVFVQFVVDKDGSLTEIEAVKKIGGGCDEEAVRVMSMAPKWNPGKQRGKPVRVRMILPIHFRLD